MLLPDEEKLRWWGIDMGPRWRRRTAVVATYIGFVPLIAIFEADIWAAHPYLALCAVILATMFWSAMSILNPNSVVRSLVGLAPVKGCKARVSGLTQGELFKQNDAMRWSLKQVSVYVTCYAGIYVGRISRHRPVDPLEVAGDLWTFSLLAQTLSQARVLWTEPDPREATQQMEVF